MVEQSIIDRAKRFARIRHGLQNYSGGPYMVHLETTAMIARMLKEDNDIICAAYLHDLLEDTETTLKELETRFGVAIGYLVYSVTNVEGKNRAERHSKTYAKIAEYEKAVRLKLCDRIANILYSITHENHSKIKMYCKENEEFKKRINPKGHYDHLPHWEYLDILTY